MMRGFTVVIIITIIIICFGGEIALFQVRYRMEVRIFRAHNLFYQCNFLTKPFLFFFLPSHPYLKEGTK